MQLTKDIGAGFEFVGAAGRAGVDEMPIQGIRNLGGMKKKEWNLEVARSAVMVSYLCVLHSGERQLCGSSANTIAARYRQSPTITFTYVRHGTGRSVLMFQLSMLGVWVFRLSIRMSSHSGPPVTNDQHYTSRLDISRRQTQVVDSTRCTEGL